MVKVYLHHSAGRVLRHTLNVWRKPLLVDNYRNSYFEVLQRSITWSLQFWSQEQARWGSSCLQFAGKRSALRRIRLSRDSMQCHAPAVFLQDRRIRVTSRPYAVPYGILENVKNLENLSLYSISHSFVTMIYHTAYHTTGTRYYCINT